MPACVHRVVIRADMPSHPDIFYVCLCCLRNVVLDHCSRSEMRGVSLVEVKCFCRTDVKNNDLCSRRLSVYKKVRGAEGVVR